MYWGLLIEDLWSKPLMVIDPKSCYEAKVTQLNYSKTELAQMHDDAYNCCLDFHSMVHYYHCIGTSRVNQGMRNENFVEFVYLVYITNSPILPLIPCVSHNCPKSPRG